MAKILDKNHSNHTKLVKLRQSYDWLSEELLGLPEKYESKKQKELNKFIASANKKLEKSAFLACDKEGYAQSELEAKLQKYDVRAYMSQRKINHGAVKAIFKAVKAGEGYGAILEKRSAEMKALNEKRAKYIATLESKKQAFLAKNNVTDTAAYDALKAELDAQYSAKKKELDEKHGAKQAAEAAKLEAKRSKISAQIAELKKNSPAAHTLPDDVLLEVKGLKMYFGGLKAVDDLDFTVKKGEIFGLIGPNGAGKTTVFNCITQFYKPTGGEIHFATKDKEVISLTDFEVHDIVLQGISRTFQNIEVVKEVSVLDNLLIAATRHYSSNLFVQMLHLPLLRREERMITARADKILKYMDLYSYRDRLAWGLPYGVLKRIEIARALMCNPQLIILDEPAAGLNESETKDLAALINKIRTELGCTILLVEHDMSLVMNVCDHICAISFGRKLADGTPAEVQASKEVQEAYLGVGGE